MTISKSSPKKRAVKAAPATTVAEYLAAAPTDKRVALTKLRKTITAAAPGAIEGIGYGIAGYKYKGKPLLYFGYAKAHCALYGGIGSVIDAHAAELRTYDVSKGTIRFTTDKPLPDRLVTKLVKARMGEIDKAG